MNKAYPAIACLIAALMHGSCGSNTGGANNTSAENKTVVVSGDVVYNRTCVACHQPNGQGVPNTFPPLAKSDYLANKEATIRQVIKGSMGELVVNGAKYNNTMPPQALSDEEIAAVLTYVYGHFGNSGSVVTPDEVKQVRSKQ